MHWEHYFGRAVNKYNRIYRYQLPPITPHVCRHTYCTNMALSGVSAKTLQYLMGHSDISITLNVYTHIKFDNAQKEVELVQQRQQKEMENVRKELEQVGAIRPKIIPFKNEALEKEYAKKDLRFQELWVLFFYIAFLDESRHIFCYNGTMHFTQKIFTVVR